MDKLKQTIIKGKQIKELLENDDVRAAWEDVQADIVKMWMATKTGEQETREALYREVHGLKALQARLQRWVNEGKKAEAELEADKRNG
ncbi:MAG: hypothetical protein R3260_18485 [Pseudomonas sp.]|nr:hypothetical protein [Pseudomonas sp.]